MELFKVQPLKSSLAIGVRGPFPNLDNFPRLDSTTLSAALFIRLSADLQFSSRKQTNYFSTSFPLFCSFPFPDGLSQSSNKADFSSLWARWHTGHTCPFDHLDKRGPSLENAGSLFHRTFSWEILEKCSPHPWKLFCSAEASVTQAFPLHYGRAPRLSKMQQCTERDSLLRCYWFAIPW